MTAYEYMDLAYSGLSLATTMVSLWIAVLSGYLIAAYTIGSNLTRWQASVLNIAYSIWGFYLLFSGATNLHRAHSHITVAAELDQQISAPAAYVLHGYAIVGLLLWMSSLWFMWSVRHPKT